ncbi:MAG: PAS domain S-box protein [Chloroflexi bacterium]|nr:PAS domain S-box protein [Chloroflexota bacterium]
MKILRNRHFWLIVLAFVLISLFHYAEQMGVAGTAVPSFHFGLTRHSLDRILFLIPIIYSGFVFGLRTGLFTSLAALVVMLPRAIIVSPAPQDALLEVASVILVGVLASLWLWSRFKEKEKLRTTMGELESAHHLLQRYVHSARINEKRLNMLNAISNVLAESLELENVLRRAIHIVTELMEVEVALVYSLDQKTQELMLIAHEGVSNEFAKAMDKIKVGEGFIGKVASTGKPTAVEDASSDPRMASPEVKKMKIRTQLIVPMTVREHIIGTLCVAMRRPRQFLVEEIDMLIAVASQIGTAIENAELYNKERLTAQRLSVSERKYRQLFEDASDAIWVHDLAGNIITTNKTTEKLTGYSREELTQMNVKAFLSDEGLNLAGKIRYSLLRKEPIQQPYEQHLIRKDRTRAILMLSTGLVVEDGKPTGFQNIARDVTEERRMEENLRYHLSQITRAQEEERKRIARELHDDTNQVLYALSRHIDNFLRENTNLKPNDVEFLKGLRQQLNEALEGVRRFSQALRPPMLDDLGLIPTIHWLVSEMEKLAKIKIELEVTGAERRFTPEVELTLFRAIQEALQNIWKHAEATKATVAVNFYENKIVVSVSDNGKGFEPMEKLEGLPRTGKLGLAGIEERIRLLGGSLKVRSQPGKGTTLIAEAPI